MAPGYTVVSTQHRTGAFAPPLSDTGCGASTAAGRRPRPSYRPIFRSVGGERFEPRAGRDLAAEQDRPDSALLSRCRAERRAAAADPTDRLTLTGHNRLAAAAAAAAAAAGESAARGRTARPAPPCSCRRPALLMGPPACQDTLLLVSAPPQQPPRRRFATNDPPAYP